MLRHIKILLILINHQKHLVLGCGIVQNIKMENMMEKFLHILEPITQFWLNGIPYICDCIDNFFCKFRIDVERRVVFDDINDSGL